MAVAYAAAADDRKCQRCPAHAENSYTNYEYKSNIHAIITFQTINQ